jgi:hypothetical protein
MRKLLSYSALISDFLLTINNENFVCNQPFTISSRPSSKLWGDGGLKDMLIESSVYAAVSVEQMMTAKQFNRAVRALTLVYEALSLKAS